MVKSTSESNIDDYMEGLACVHAVGGYPSKSRNFPRENKKMTE